MSFTINERRAFKEANEIISIMGEKYNTKVPKSLLEFLKREEDKEYVTKIKKELSFKNQEISRTALILLNYINLNYWLDEEKKNRVRQSYRQNEQKHQEELKKRYNPDEIFKKRGNK